MLYWKSRNRECCDDCWNPRAAIDHDRRNAALQPLTASAVGVGCSKNRLVVGFEELVTARSVRERYSVSTANL